MGSGHDAHVPCEHLSRARCVRSRKIRFAAYLADTGAILTPCSARIFLGLTEAGLFPGVNYYLSMWYPRSDRGVRIAIFYSAATVAGAFGGIIA